ncbi:glycosyltransferase [Streptomyces heilongjiangensis]|uniref:Glycosyltransferase n=1 Tax=Streptomyces heilongjiangensis TaxID=945052 RepID=A0ABW1BD56_9ACTN|nr:nucleotide disphospho-sugar-binding domain-containing protein [Streptomyces heilongjiangensis]MDC2948771.1 DUF1205 domain-containing protein [Streptomyces heilongjiangensis]
MKILFVVAEAETEEAGPVSFQVPLAQAARNAGHEVIMAVSETGLPAALEAGIAAVPLPESVPHDGRRDGRALGRLAAGSVVALTGLADAWRPDLVIASAQAHAGPLTARHAGVPWIRFATDLEEPVSTDLATTAELTPELGRSSLRALPRPSFSVSVLPAALRPATAPEALALRHIPYAPQVPLRPWMYAAGHRPRVLVAMDGPAAPDGWFGPDRSAALLSRLAGVEADLVVATTDEETAARLEPLLPPGGRAGRPPLDVLVPTCDLVVHPGSAGATLASLAHGVPQLRVPGPSVAGEHGLGERIADHGAGRLLRVGGCTPDADAIRIAASVREMLGDPSYRTAANRLREEVHRMPAPDALIGRLERSAASHRAPRRAPADQSDKHTARNLPHRPPEF